MRMSVSPIVGAIAALPIAFAANISLGFHDNLNTTTHRDFAQLGAASSEGMRLFELLGNLRKQGHTCPDGTYHPPNNGRWEYDCRLQQSATKWSMRMAKEHFIGHVYGGSTACQRTTDERYPKWQACSEVLTGGSPTAEDAFSGLKKSNEHCNVMLASYITQAGSGYVYDPSSDWKTYFTVDFGSYWRSPDQTCIGGSPATYPKPGCENTELYNCDLYKQKGLCNVSPNVAAGCKDTCQEGRCKDSQPGPSPGCHDDPSQACAYYASHGLCTDHVKQLCPQSCGACVLLV
eukprot:TRINITY_DN5692_c0_g1_i1.p1 TRINITY_DN5692_c0_g1~~TRINITY_DN5692_c0_g1_i1.p1  ORF type:complete len:290 (+),score=32.37 TRINITY_DN5692_c0_g1_i1:75-944(+)